MPAKIRLFSLFFQLLCTLFSCSPAPKTEKPTIPEQTMVSLLADLHLAEAIIAEKPYPQRDSFTQVAYTVLFKQYNINKKIFEKNLSLYLSDPDASMNLYDKVLKNVQTLQAKYPEKTHRITDSTQVVKNRLPNNKR
jgi:hypothetical protein